jgi:hypothetical protein
MIIEQIWAVVKEVGTEVDYSSGLRIIQVQRSTVKMMAELHPGPLLR